MSILRKSAAKSAPASAPVNPLAAPMGHFFKACSNMKEDRRAMKIAACNICIALTKATAITLTAKETEGLNKAAVSRLDSMIASTVMAEVKYNKAEKSMTLTLVKQELTPADIDELRKGRLPHKYDIEREIDLDAISRRITSLLKGLSEDDITAVLDDVKSNLEAETEQA